MASSDNNTFGVGTSPVRSVISLPTGPAKSAQPDGAAATDADDTSDDRSTPELNADSTLPHDAAREAEKQAAAVSEAKAEAAKFSTSATATGLQRSFLIGDYASAVRQMLGRRMDGPTAAVGPVSRGGSAGRQQNALRAGPEGVLLTAASRFRRRWGSRRPRA
ncbi:hypothetical protein OG705_00535 [Streptomyces sp. NBC_00838]|uniref:hypothetical protein n=1 Tax=Streptomyces sp. NBC_00838 TaxID=2903680 RepID=UPI00386E1833|nr:hypothetical protein OG705_00535 [Streptomyces sp. NBC_00838]